MKKHRGFSLIECMVALAIVTIIISMGIPAFSAWRSKHETEGQCRALLRHLSFARMKAYSEKKIVGIFWDNSTDTFTSYQVVEDANGDGDIVDNGTDKQVLREVTRFSWRATPSTNALAFDGRGFSLTDQTIFHITDGSDAAGITNCITVVRTKIQSGFWDGATCVPK